MADRWEAIIESWEARRAYRHPFVTVDLWERKDQTVSAQITEFDGRDETYTEADFDRIDEAYRLVCDTYFGAPDLRIYIDGKQVNDRGTYGK